MAGDTFDAGTVYAEARLDRDQFQRDLTELRRDLARFERERYQVRIGADQEPLDEGVATARRKVRDLGKVRVRPTVGANIRTFLAAALNVRRQMDALNRTVAIPLVMLDTARTMVRVSQLRYELAELSRRVVIDVVINPPIFQSIRRLSDEMVSFRNVMRMSIPPMVPLLGLAAGGANVLAASLLGAGGAAGVFALAAIPALVGVFEKSKEIEKAQKAVTEAVTDEQRETALRNLEIALSAVAEKERQAVQDVGMIKAAWREFQDAIQPAVFGVLNNSVSLISKLLPPLVPVVEAVARVMNGWIDSMEAAVDRGGLKRFADWLAGPGVQQLDAWARSIANFSVGLLNMFMGSGPAMNDFATGMLNLSTRFREWSETLATNQSWQEFITFTRTAMPDVLTILGELIKLFWEVHRVFAPVTVAVLDFVAGFMKAHPQVTKFLVVGYVVTQFLTGLVMVFAGVIIKVLLFAAIFGRIGQVFNIAKTASLLWRAAMVGDMAKVLSLSRTLFTQLWRLTFVSRVFGAITKATVLWTGAQWALNAAMAANPIGLVIAALVAVIAAIVLAIVYWDQIKAAAGAAWDWIVEKAQWAWNSVLKPAFDGIVAALQWVGDKFVWLYNNAIRPAWDGIVAGAKVVGGWISWLWETIIKPVFDFIGLAARILLAVVVTAVLAPIMIAIKLLGALVMWLWTDGIKPSFDDIGAAAMWLWNNAIKPAMDGIGAAVKWVYDNILKPTWDRTIAELRAVGDFFVWVWNSLIKPAWDALGAGVQWVVDNILVPTWQRTMAELRAVGDFFVWIWNTIIKPAWDALGAGVQWVVDNVLKPTWDKTVAELRAVGDFFVAVWNNVIKPAWDALGAGIKWVNDNVLQPVWNGIQTALDAVKRAFEIAVDGIKIAWDKIREIVAVPIRFMVNLVYNQGIVPAWNWIAGIVNLPKLEPVRLGFAEGGIVPGRPSPGRDNHLAAVGSGEAIMRPEWTAAVGADNVEHWNRVARMGGPRAVKRALNSGSLVEGADHNGPGASTVGFGGVRPHVAQAGHYLKRRFGIGTVGGVGQRANASDHPKGLALDFMVGRDMAKGDALSNFLSSAANWAHFAVKYIIWKQRISSSPGAWRGMADRGSVTANHFDHPHVSFLGGPGSGPMDGGGFGFIDQLTEMWKKVLDFMKRVGEFTGTVWGQGAMGLLQKLVDGSWTHLAAQALGSVTDLYTPMMGDGTRAPLIQMDTGGWLPTGLSAIYNGTGQPEAVLTNPDFQSLIREARGPVGEALNGPPLAGRGVSNADVTRRLDAMIELLADGGAGAVINQSFPEGSDPGANAQATVMALKVRGRRILNR